MKRFFTAAVGYIKKLDKTLLLICAGLSVFGVVLLYTLDLNEISPFVTSRQWKMNAAASAVGIAAALVIAGIDYHFIAKMWFVYAPAALILVLLLFTPLGMQVEGADDIGWLNLGFISIQPSELLKVAFIVTLSLHLSKVGKKMNQIHHFLLLCAHAAIPAGLIVLQGDDGSALVFACIFIVLMFMAGVSWKYIAAAAVAAPAAVYVLWNYVMQPHQLKRFLVLFDEEIQQQEILGIYYHQWQSKIALGSGQLRGLGLSGGNYTYVPEIDTDFIFSYIGMTLGFIGCAATIAVLLALCIKVLSDASAARDPLGKYICVGVFTMIAFHSIVNIGMVLAVVPVIGIPLPFISAGGTSVVSMYAAVGLVLSVRAHRVKKTHMFYTEKD